MKKIVVSIFILLMMTQCDEKSDSLVVIHTPYGDMTVMLYDQTPQHKQNFLKLASEGSYDSTIFHRVIKGFMIQGGDLNLVEPNTCTGTLPAEIRSDLFHTKGALAAARQGDQVNPKKKSSACQFYIVQGTPFDTTQLTQMAENKKFNYYNMKMRELLAMEAYAELKEEIMQLQSAGDRAGLQSKFMDSWSLIDEEFGSPAYASYPSDVKMTYKETGGSPHLDGDYTVFGRVVDGMAVIDSIAAVQTGRADKPLQDVHMTMEVVVMKKRKISKEFGVEYTEEGNTAL